MTFEVVVSGTTVHEAIRFVMETANRHPFHNDFLCPVEKC